MMEQVVELAANFLQTLIWTWFITSFFGRKRDGIVGNLSFIGVTLIAFFVISYINMIVVYDGLLSGLLILTYIIYSRLFLKGGLGEHIFINVYAIAIIFTISSVLIFIASYFSGINTEGIIADLTMWRFVAIILCRLFEFLAFKCIVKINAKSALTKKEWILFTAMPLATWIAVVFMTNATINAPKVLTEMFYIAIIMVVINIITFFFLFKIKEDAQTKMDYELLRMQQDNVKTMETNMKALYDSTYSVKHDLEKHLIAVKTMVETGKYSDVSGYIENIVAGLNDVQRVIFTDNDIFNAIINTKLTICKSKGIFPNINVSNEAISLINPSDIVVLFGNLFDNAIEATEKTSDKIIILNVSTKRDYVSVYMENSFNSEYSDVKLNTTKSDNAVHGIGTKNIRRIVQENNGMIDYFVNDNSMFCCDILLKKKS
ncbi:MAG: sensor histidine kinase [Clostridia bacterium]